MDDILSYLEDLTQPDRLPEEYFSLLHATDPYTSVIQDKLSLEFLDGLDDTQSELVKWERREGFSRGFRLGAQLMLSLFTEPRKP